jgi:hypothetical protein
LLIAFTQHHIADRPRRVYFSFVKTLPLLFLLILTGGTMSLADSKNTSATQGDAKFEERTVFITGSLIPYRIKVRRVGTTTTSPVRIIDRREIDQTGRVTTPGAFVNEPSVRIIGH